MLKHHLNTPALSKPATLVRRRIGRGPRGKVRGLFSSQNFTRFFQDFPSHRIFGRMYEALNIDKK
jgi:hypothetical protein